MQSPHQTGQNTVYQSQSIILSTFKATSKKVVILTSRTKLNTNLENASHSVILGCRINIL